MSDERVAFELELADLGVREFFVGGLLNRLLRKPTLGFEFDIHYGLVKEVLAHDGVPPPADGALITDHTDAADGFRVKLDGTRLEAATKPFEVTTKGRIEMDAAIKRLVREFAGELRARCEAATPLSVVVANRTGLPRPFKPPRTVVAGLRIARLPVRRRFDPKQCSVWAAPQATLTIPLAKVPALVKEIKASEGKGPGVGLTGGAGHRMGLRSEAIYRALHHATNARTRILAQRPPLALSNGTVVNPQSFSETLLGFLTLLASYLWTSELPYKNTPPGRVGQPWDYEHFAKAYVPVNVKAPFSEIFRTLLDANEQRVFREVFGGAAARTRLFRLARPTGPIDVHRKLFPPGPTELGRDSVHERLKQEFSGRAPTWDDLVAHTLDSTHRGWGDRLMVGTPPTGSNTIPVARTAPRVALELRRVGFNAVFSHQWQGFTDAVFRMTSRLNA